MKIKTYNENKLRISDQNLLNWTSKTVADLVKCGYKIYRVSHNMSPSNTNDYQIQILYDGNIFQRIWRKLTQW